MSVETGRDRRPTHDFGWSTSGNSEPATARPRYAGSSRDTPGAAGRTPHRFNTKTAKGLTHSTFPCLGQPLSAQAQDHSPLAVLALSHQTPGVGSVCWNSARTDLSRHPVTDGLSACTLQWLPATKSQNPDGRGPGLNPRQGNGCNWRVGLLSRSFPDAIHKSLVIALHQALASRRTISATRSAIIIVGIFVLVRETSGITEASATNRFSAPTSFPAGSTTV
jgi:hypothetical protein